MDNKFLPACINKEINNAYSKCLTVELSRPDPVLLNVVNLNQTVIAKQVEDVISVFLSRETKK